MLRKLSRRLAFHKAHGRAEKRAKLLQQLEARVLFSGSPLPVDAFAGALGDEFQHLGEMHHDAAPQDSDPAQTVTQEIVFVDRGIEDYQSLLQSIGDGLEVVILDADRDGLQQIAETLVGRSDINAIHIVSHGEQGELRLGDAALTEESMLGKHAAALRSIGGALSEHADLLIYGCDFGMGKSGAAAAKQLANLTGADVAASDDLSGGTEWGGDWDLELATGTIEAGLLFDAESTTSFIGTLALSDATLNIISDGTPVWDGDNNPGNDTDGTNGIIRTHDTISMEVFYNTDAGGATDLNMTSTLPDGLVWDFLPAAAALDPRSMIVDSTTGLEGGDMRTMIAYLPDVSGTFTSSIAFEARALGGAQGTALNGLTFEVDANENAVALATDSFDFTLSSAAHMDLRLLSPTFRGVFKDATGTVDGVVYSYGIGIFGDHPTRTGTDGVKGSAPIEDPFTFDVDLTNVSPNASVFSWGNVLGGVAEAATDGINRNYERYVNSGGSTVTAWSQSNRPAGQTLEHPTSAVWSEERSTPDSGDFTITGSAGGVHSVQVTGSDTTGPHFPDRYGGGGVVPASDKWFASGTLHVWIPIDDILPGEDGVLGNDDDGVLTVVPELTNFDPNDAYGITNNFGAGTEDLTNNDYSHEVVSFSIGGPTKYNSEYGHPSSGRWVDTSSSWSAGDGETSVGHQYESRVSSGRNLGILNQTGVIFGDKFDNSATKLVPNALPGNSGNNWSRIYVSGGPNAGTFLTYGTDYIIEFGIGGVGGAAGGWTDWNSMGDATLADGESPVWTQDPTDILALGGTADPVTGVSDAITKYRIKLLRDLEPGEAMIALVSMETTGHSTLDLANNPGGNIIANFVAGTSDFLLNDMDPDNDWRTSEYDPEINGWYPEGVSSAINSGDRLWIVEANVDVDKLVVDLGAGNSYLAGSAATIQLDPTVTIPGPDSGAPAQDVYVTDILPPGLTVIGGSATPGVGTTYIAGDGSTQTVQAVEYWDGTSWDSTWTYGDSGIRWYFGDVPLNTQLPTLTFDVLIPYDAQNGESWTNTAVISSPSDDTTEEFRSSSAGLVAVQVAAMAAGKQVVTPLVPEDSRITYELGVANVSDDKDVPWIDLVDILPYNGDFEGSSFGGVYTGFLPRGRGNELGDRSTSRSNRYQLILSSQESPNLGRL